MARSGARTSKNALVQVKAQGHARARGLVLLVLLVVLELGVLTGSQAQRGQVLLGLALWFGANIVSTALTLALGVALGARVIWLTIGFGPRLSRRVVGDHMRVVRALPIVVGGGVLPRKHTARVWRLFTGSYLVLPFIFTAIAAQFVPGRSASTMALITVTMGVLLATNRDPGSGRMLAARVFVKPGEHTDPGLTRPDHITAQEAVVDVHFGDFAQAEAKLAQLRAQENADQSVALASLTAELLAARGEYDKALRVPFPQQDPADARPLTEAQAAKSSATAAKLMLLAAEKDPQLAEKALSMAPAHLRAVAMSGTGLRADRTGRALYALMSGAMNTAKRENRICMARARTPLALADALCTQARIEAASGDRKKAAKHLDEASRLAPWYPRVITVRQLAGAEGAAHVPQPLSAAPTGADTSHVFAEPWSVSAPPADQN